MTYAELSLSQKAMFDMSRVERTGAGVAIAIPLISTLQRVWPHYTFMDDDWKVVSRLLLATGNKLPWEGEPVAPVPVSKPLKTALPVGSVEARIRELSGDNLVRVAGLNRVAIEVHATNAGITAMRRKNALLTLMRRGASISL